MHRAKHITEYAALRVLGGTSNLVPERVALAMGSIYASIGFQLFRRKRHAAQQRIRQVFGDQFSDEEVTHIARAAFRDLVWHSIEVLRTPKMTREWVQRNAIIDPIDRRRFDESIAMGRGVIIAVPHLANWDLAGVGLQRLGYPMTFIVRKQKNPLFDQYLNQMRSHLGSDVIERDDPVLIRKVIRALKQGRVVAILIDLRSRHQDLQLPFLGQTADLSRGLGLMSHLANCPVVPAYAKRTDDGRHQWHFKDAVMPDRAADRNQDAARIVRDSLPPLEHAIRSAPEQYFWFNKRWVLERIAA